MRRSMLIGIVLLGCLVLSPLVSMAAQTSLYERSTLATVIAARGTAVQSTTSAGSPVNGFVMLAESVILLGKVESGAWWWAETSAGYGYIRASDVQPAGDITRLPEVGDDLAAVVLPPELPVDDATKYPILPELTDYSRTIWERGQKFGLRADVFTKVGDCLTSDKYKFLGRFGSDGYDLGEYAYLQEVVTYYQQTPPREGQPNSFWNESIAAYKGFNAASVLDPLWQMTALCPPEDSPLACEYRLTKPALAIIMFGANDINTLTPAQFDFYLRVVVHQTIDRGILPLLSTFPGNPRSDGRSHQFNQIVYQIARDYDVPIMNLWLALQPLPDHGRERDTVYMTSTPQTHVSYFTPEHLKYGYTMRNLVTLEALDLVWRELIHGD
ncbi:MAG: SGNH/GDSL hydrolase family protein [Anaerolineae bacterium]